MISFTLPRCSSTNLAGEPFHALTYSPLLKADTLSPHAETVVSIDELIVLHALDASRRLDPGDTPNGTYSLLVNVPRDHVVYQRMGGSAIFRLLDFSTLDTTQFLFNLCTSYKYVTLCMPAASRTSITYAIARTYHTPLGGACLIPCYFRMKVEEIYVVFGQAELDNLRV